MSESNIQERPAYQQRVIAERESRFAELARLLDFVYGHAIVKLPAEDRKLLREQAKCMSELVSILDRRISRF